MTPVRIIMRQLKKNYRNLFDVDNVEKVAYCAFKNIENPKKKQKTSTPDDIEWDNIIARF